MSSQVACVLLQERDAPAHLIVACARLRDADEVRTLLASDDVVRAVGPCGRRYDGEGPNASAHVQRQHALVLRVGKDGLAQCGREGAVQVAVQRHLELRLHHEAATWRGRRHVAVGKVKSRSVVRRDHGQRIAHVHLLQWHKVECLPNAEPCGARHGGRHR